MKTKQPGLDEFIEMSMEAYANDDSIWDEMGINKETYITKMLNKIKTLNKEILEKLNKDENKTT